jgi:hypothetical protein
MQEALFGDPGPTEPGPEEELSCRDLTAAWIDRVREVSSHPPPKQTVGKMIAQIRELLKTHPPDLIRDALLLAANDGKPPALLPDLVLRVQTHGDQATVRDWVQQNGWPTGTRFVRGSHGGSYVPDPLGYDRAPHPVSWGSPTRVAIREALERLHPNG